MPPLANYFFISNIVGGEYYYSKNFAHNKQVKNPGL